MTTNNGKTIGTLAERLAEKICAFTPAAITAKSLALSRTAIIDTIAVSLAGIPEPCCQILLQTPGVADGPGPSLIFGTDRRTSALDAALINGVAAHALDYDDVNQAQSGHHSAPLVAPLFALGEMRRASGRQIIAAYIIGVETEIRIARTLNAVNFHHYDKGWHPTATLGTFGAAAAASHLARPRPRAHGEGAGAGRVVRLRHQGQLRHDDEADACRPMCPQRPVRGARGRARF